MGGGAMWKNVARVVGVAAAPTVAVSNASFCSACTAASPSPRAPSSSSSVRGATSCTCQATAIQQHGISSNSFTRGKKLASWEIDDWEFAGDEEKDYYVFGTPPTMAEVEEATADLQNALRLGMLAAAPASKVESPRSSPFSSVVEITKLSSVMTVRDEEGETSSAALVPLQPDWMEPPLALELTTVARETGAPSSAMLEAFHQFQHNPQVQGLVLSLATDKTVWEAVLANQKIQEYRHKLLEVEGTTTPDPADATSPEKPKSFKSSNIFSRLFWSTKTAFDNFIKQFQEFMSTLFSETADKNNNTSGNEKGSSNLFEWSVKACMMLAVVVLAIVVFKRAAVVRRV